MKTLSGENWAQKRANQPAYLDLCTRRVDKTEMALSLGTKGQNKSLLQM